MTDEAARPPTPFSFDAIRPSIEVRNSLPVFTIPPDVVHELQDGSKRIINRIADPQTKPDLVLVLERSAPSAYAATQTIAQKEGVELPPSLNVHIGREIDSKFTTELAQRVEEETGEDIFESGDNILEKYRAQYAKWMETDPYVRRLLGNMKQHIEQIKKLRDIKRILIVDDTSSEGNTKNHTVPLLMEHLFAELQEKPPVDFEKILENGSWHMNVLRATFKQQLPYDVSYTMAELMTGFLEDFEAEDGLVPITNEGHIRQITGQARDRSMFMQSSEPEKIIDSFGLPLLTKFREGLTASIQQSVNTM